MQINSVAIVTGASQGIGRATAIRLARDFEAVVLTARQEAELKKTAAEVKPQAPKPWPSRLPSGALNRRGNVETRRMQWLSRVNPVAGPWSRSEPESNRPVNPGEQPPAFSPHSVSGRTRRNWRLGDFPQVMIKRQGESWVSVCAVVG